MKKTVIVILVLALLAGFAGCSEKKEEKTKEEIQPAQQEAAGTVGICMPNMESPWSEGAAALENKLRSFGYETKTKNAQNSVESQQRQIELLIEDKVCCIVIAPVDPMSLTKVLEKAEQAGIPVVAYDRQLLDAPGVDALVSFDYAGIGADLGQRIVEKLDLETALREETVYTVEFLMGAAEDDRAQLAHAGLMQVLQPYLDGGALLCKTGRTAFADTYTVYADPDTAGQRLAGYLEKYYEKASPDLLCAASDQMAAACEDVLETAEREGETQPLIVSLGGPEVPFDGITACKDYATLSEICAKAVHCMVSGQELSVDRTVDNHVSDVPALLLESLITGS